MERIKEVPNHKGIFVSTTGKVFSTHASHGINRIYGKPPQLLSGYKNGGGKVGKYLRVTFYSNGVYTKRYIHQLVYSTFTGEIHPKWHVHHKDGNHTNNRVENLQLLHPLEHKGMHHK